MSLIEFQHISQQIKNKLYELSYKIDCFNKSGDLDISRYAETYFKEILNVIYSNVWFFEKAVKINQDTYDLYDLKNKVCVQVTSNNRQSKKVKTIKQFEANRHKDTFDTLIILFTSNSKPKKKLSCDFNCSDYDITELCGLIESKCIQEDLLKIRDILYFDYEKDSKIVKSKEVDANSLAISEEEFKRCIKLEEDLKRDLLIPQYWKQFSDEEISKNPYQKFISSRFILRSYTDETYPSVENNSEWERTFMYDFYEKGILIWLGALAGYMVYVNNNNEWYIKDLFSKEETPKGFVEVNLRILGKLPYKHILHYKDGDEYYTDFHLFCKYDGIEKSPYVELIYYAKNNSGYFWIELDKNKRLKE
jgi:hypothetical protein